MLLYYGDRVPRRDSTNSVYADQERGIFILAYGPVEDTNADLLIRGALQISSARLERATGSIEERIREALTLANNEIYSILQTLGGDYDLICNIAAVVSNGTEVINGYAGDVKLYLIKPDSIIEINSDSTTEILDGDKSLRLPQAVGDGFGLREHEPDDINFITIKKLSFEVDNALLLCSKSISAVLSSGEIFNIIMKHPGNRTRIMQALFDAAHSGSDNPMSALFLEGQQFARSLRRYKRLLRHPNEKSE